MISTASDSRTQTERVDYGRLWWVALLAAGGAAIVNGIIFVIAEAAGFIPRNFVIELVGQSLSLAPVVGSTIVGVIIGAVVFAIMGRFARRPISLFRIVAIVVLVLSFAQPLLIAGAPLSMILTLELMHIVAGAFAIGLLTTLTRRA